MEVGRLISWRLLCIDSFGGHASQFYSMNDGPGLSRLCPIYVFK
jgi:hypothetical protein